MTQTDYQSKIIEHFTVLQSLKVSKSRDLANQKVMPPTKETKGVKAKAKAVAKTDTKTKKAVAKATKGKSAILRP